MRCADEIIDEGIFSDSSEFARLDKHIKKIKSAPAKRAPISLDSGPPLIPTRLDPPLPNSSSRSPLPWDKQPESWINIGPRRSNLGASFRLGQHLLPARSILCGGIMRLLRVRLHKTHCAGETNKQAAAQKGGERGWGGGQLKPSQGLIYGPDPDDAANSIVAADWCACTSWLCATFPPVYIVERGCLFPQECAFVERTAAIANTDTLIGTLT